MHFLSHIGRIPAGGLPETNSNWLVSVLLFWVRKSREKSSCPYFNLFSLLHKAGYFLAGVALGVGSSIFNEDAFRFGEFRLQHWGLGDWWCNGEFSCLIVLDSGNPAETWWHLMNWCDFWVKNSLQIQMILPPRPGVPVFFFPRRLWHFWRKYTSPQLLQIMGVAGPPMQDMATWLKVTLDGVEKMVNSYSIL